MDKNFIRILIVVMLAALVGLIILQTIYLRDAIKVKDNHFSQLVSQSLAETFQQLEINKTMEYFNIDTFSSEKAHAIQKPIKKENTIEGSIGFEFMIDEGITYLEDTFFCTSNVRISVFSSDSMVFAIENDIGEIESQTYYFGNNNRKKSYNNNPQENVVSKQFGYIENMVGRILSIDRGTKWELNQRELETTIRQSLENNGISLYFEYAVLEPSTGYILSSSNFQLQSEKDIYRIQITPDNFFAQANYLELFFPHKESFLLSSTGTMGISSFILIITIIGLFAVSLIIIIRQKKLSEMKNDFINNMTHELKTPISTLSLAGQMLKDGNMDNNRQMVSHISNIIEDETKRLGYQVEKVLQVALFEKGKLKFDFVTVEINAILLKVKNSFDLHIQKKEGSIVLDLDKKSTLIKADEIHLTNVVFNLLDNAIKYCSETPHIKLSTQALQNGVSIGVIDNGIGIAKEYQQKIFENFFRVSTGNIHNVKGFGLGLSYVKKIVDEHQGTIKVESKPGSGTTFTLFFPSEHQEIL